MIDLVLNIWYTYRDFLKWVLETIANGVHSGGLAIIVFTLIIKTLLLPLTLKSIRSMKAMQEIQPKIKELQKKYGKNREELQKQTMALYAAHQVNPVAGCLPMVIQIPIFWGVYRAILPLSKSGSGDFADNFLWLRPQGDLTALAAHDALHLLPILAGLFQFVQMRMSRPRNAPAAADPQQQIMNTMMNFMPLMVVVFGWTFASGAVIYWATQSVYSVVQQWFVTGWGDLGKWAPWLPELPEHRRLGYVKPRNVDDLVVEYNANGTPRAGGFMGRLQARLESAQAQQNQRQPEKRSEAGDTTDADIVAVPAKASQAKSTRSPQGKRSGKRRAAGQGITRGAAAKPTAATAKASSEKESTARPAARPATTSASYASRVGGASRRGPKSSWEAGGNNPKLAGGSNETGDD